MNNNFTGFFTSESVSEGHPDKVADLIADSIIDDIVGKDPEAHTAVEVFTSKGIVIVGGEVRTKAQYDVQAIVRKTLEEIGYTDESYGISSSSCCVMNMINAQSTDIAAGVDCALEIRGGVHDVEEEIGAGDQGLMFGYACRETKEYMPLPITLAHALVDYATELRKTGKLDWARPDMKSQVTVKYENGLPVSVHTVVMAIQHSPEVSQEKIIQDTVEKVVVPVLSVFGFDHKDTILYVNSSGRFVLGGPACDTGLTGRKIVVDTYGGMCPHGGGAISGKDVTKVDRIGQYMARYIAKNIVAADLAQRCQVQLAYTIGKADPVGFYVDTMGTGLYSDDILTEAAKNVFDCRPKSIIGNLNLRRPIYSKYANYGQFGHSSAPWEQIDKTEEIANEVKRILNEEN